MQTKLAHRLFYDTHKDQIKTTSNVCTAAFSIALNENLSSLPSGQCLCFSKITYLWNSHICELD